jgi:hypothetical protein
MTAAYQPFHPTKGMHLKGRVGSIWHTHKTYSRASSLSPQASLTLSARFESKRAHIAYLQLLCLKDFPALPLPHAAQCLQIPLPFSTFAPPGARLLPEVNKTQARGAAVKQALLHDLYGILNEAGRSYDHNSHSNVLD